jgi:hypothetical protein
MKNFCRSSKDSPLSDILSSLFCMLAKIQNLDLNRLYKNCLISKVMCKIPAFFHLCKMESIKHILKYLSTYTQSGCDLLQKIV